MLAFSIRRKPSCLPLVSSHPALCDAEMRRALPAGQQGSGKRDTGAPGEAGCRDRVQAGDQVAPRTAASVVAPSWLSSVDGPRALENMLALRRACCFYMPSAPRYSALDALTRSAYLAVHGCGVAHVTAQLPWLLGSGPLPGLVCGKLQLPCVYLYIFVVFLLWSYFLVAQSPAWSYWVTQCCSSGYVSSSSREREPLQGPPALYERAYFPSVRPAFPLFF